ncbi:MAG: peptide chain release factor N(5)-glutamine methyltransferase [Deltaproteobacteria bacterium]|jgi:release factor glutamine methyltransferase|nr:peptide chain release factor N(5)-glutamine methyltransferase [Deltaproteobacteria bacterium]
MSEKVWTVASIISVTTDFLAKKDPTCPRLEAELLLSEIMGLDRVKLYVNFERELTDKEVAAYRELVKRRAAHEPVAYILGRKEFYRLPLLVTKDTLIPRPETEHLVDEAVRLAKEFADETVEAADIGCGSGAIAVALAKTLPKARVKAVELSAPALEVAKINAQKHGVSDQIEFFLGNLLEPLGEARFHLICANLPYVPDADLETLAPDVAAFEPKTALAGGPDGLSLVGPLIAAAPGRLLPGGRLVLEIWPDSFAKATNLAKEAGLTPLEPILDYSAKNRVLVAGI